MLDASNNIMVRSGAHCVHSWFNANNLKGSVRASLYLYNTEEEANIFISTMKNLMKVVK
jgi:cysteine desulfurase/selenocysteine lyase